MIAGKLPFKGYNKLDLEDSIILDEPVWSNRMSNKTISLLKLMLEKDPEKRCDTKTVLKTLQ